MRRLVAGALTLLAGVAPLPAARAADPDSNPVSEAIARAAAFWGGTPCRGAVTLVGSLAYGHALYTAVSPTGTALPAAHHRTPHRRM
jgi:hypothetical protein